jgi:hypothetical protein
MKNKNGSTKRRPEENSARQGRSNLPHHFKMKRLGIFDNLDRMYQPGSKGDLGDFIRPVIG